MNRLRYYVLTSRHSWTLQRCLRSLPLKRTVVVVNTLDDDYAELAFGICESLGVEVCRTESDGTPGTGKNSLLKTFLDSPDEFAVCIDGDDFITPYGVFFYDLIASRDKVPDLVVTCNEVVSNAGDVAFDYFQKNSSIHNWRDFGDNHLYICPSTDRISFEEGVERMCSECPERTREEVEEWIEKWQRYVEFMYEYSDDNTRPTRMVFWSRKAAELAHYSNELYIGEDTIQYLQMKQHYGRGEIDICYHDEDPFPTYIYVTDYVNEAGVSHIYHPDDVDWTDKLIKVVDKYLPFRYNHTLVPTNVLDYS